MGYDLGLFIISGNFDGILMNNFFHGIRMKPPWDDSVGVFFWLPEIKRSQVKDFATWLKPGMLKHFTHLGRFFVRVDLRSDVKHGKRKPQDKSWVFFASAVCWGNFCEEKWWFWAPSMLEKWRDLDCISEGFQFWFEWINSSFMHFNVFHAVLFAPTRKSPTQIFWIGTKTSSATPSDGVVLRWFDMGKMTQGVNY